MRQTVGITLVPFFVFFFLVFRIYDYLILPTDVVGEGNLLLSYAYKEFSWISLYAL